MKIHIKEVDDWVTVWKDGECVYGNHRCNLRDGLEALGLAFKYEWREFPDDEYDVEAQGWLDTPPDA